MHPPLFWLPDRQASQTYSFNAACQLTTTASLAIDSYRNARRGFRLRNVNQEAAVLADVEPGLTGDGEQRLRGTAAHPSRRSPPHGYHSPQAFVPGSAFLLGKTDRVSQL